MIIIFARREIADEWWRVVSPSQISQLKGNIQRITPQFYNHHTAQWNVMNFFTDPILKPSSAPSFRSSALSIMPAGHRKC
jgi:hypothetical protein